MKQKRFLQTFVVIGALLTFAGTASAHVSVSPKETTTNAYEKYTVRVPVEKDVNTTKVRVEFPAGVSVSTVAPVPNWNYEFEKDADGRFKAITWSAIGGGIKPHEFTEFSFVGKNPSEAGELAWKAYQTYADGNVVEWTGAPGTDTPASVTKVVQGNAESGHSHGGTAPSNDQGAAAPSTGHDHGAATPTPDEAASGASGVLPIVMSGLALLLSLVSLFRKK